MTAPATPKLRGATIGVICELGEAEGRSYTVCLPAINGSLDRQVPADENLAAIGAALAHNADVTVRKLDGLNHLFQTASTGAIGEYADIGETMCPMTLDIATEWIDVRFKGTTKRVR